MHEDLLRQARQEIAKLAQRWNGIFDIETMHATYAGKEAWMVPGAGMHASTERIWTDKPLTEKTADLKEMIANLGKRVDAMKTQATEQRFYAEQDPASQSYRADLYHGKMGPDVLADYHRTAEEERLGALEEIALQETQQRQQKRMSY